MQSSNASIGEETSRVRRLEMSGKSKGFIALLQQLSVCDSVSDEEFEERFQELRSYGEDHLIEDVAVDAGARGKQLGKQIVEFLIDHARAMGCYKVIIECNENNRVFYEKCGFKQKEIQMVKYFI